MRLTTNFFRLIEEIFRRSSFGYRLRALLMTINLLLYKVVETASDLVMSDCDNLSPAFGKTFWTL